LRTLEYRIAGSKGENRRTETGGSAMADGDGTVYTTMIRDLPRERLRELGAAISATPS
jgi:hypothetical protein